jgi:hypothetical protein
LPTVSATVFATIALIPLNYLQDLLSEDGDGQGFFLFRPLDAKAIEAIFQTT